jgi:hypothetical protein
MPTDLPQCCYVLTARKGTEFLAMTHAALLTLRHHHPSVDVRLFIDTPTESVLDAEYPAIRNDVTEIIVVDTGLEEAPASSRFIKTKLREFVSGDFVYLDIDTVVLRDLSGICDHSRSVAAVEYDTYSGGNFPAEFLDKFRRLGWPAPRAPYLNSGVMYWKDDDEARKLSEAWYTCWAESREIVGNTDQPPLHQAIVSTGASVELLREDYNQTIRDDPRKLKIPIVLHYTTSAALNKKYVLINYLMQHLKEHGKLDVKMLERAARRNDPWVSAGPGIKGNWVTGRYWAAVRAGVNRVMGLKTVN